MSDLPLEFSEAFGETLRRVRKIRHYRQLDLATAVSVDHSLVSRWESGAVHPTARDLTSIRKSLQLNDAEFEDLIFAWQRTRDRHDIDPGLAAQKSEELIDSLQISVECARALRKAGQPRIALLVSNRDATVAFDRIRGRRWTLGNVAALTELSELLLEQCKAGLDCAPGAAVRRGALDKVVGRLGVICKICEAERADFFYQIAREAVAYVAGNTGDAYEMSQSLFGSRQQTPTGWLPEVIRATAIAGKHGDAGALMRAESELQKALQEHGEEFPGGTHAYVLEGLARGWVNIDPAHGYELIVRAWAIRKSSRDTETNSMLRFVQLVRSQAEIEASLRTHTNVSDTAGKIGKALLISRSEGYDRYIDQLEALVGRLQ